MDLLTGKYEEFKNYNFANYVIDDVLAFIKEKNKYLETRDADDAIYVYETFEDVYCRLKSQWVCGKITEDTFWKLVGILKEGF